MSRHGTYHCHTQRGREREIETLRQYCTMKEYNKITSLITLSLSLFMIRGYSLFFVAENSHEIGH